MNNFAFNVFLKKNYKIITKIIYQIINTTIEKYYKFKKNFFTKNKL